MHSARTTQKKASVGADVLEECRGDGVSNNGSSARTLQAITRAAQHTGAQPTDQSFSLRALYNLNGVAITRDGRLFAAYTVRDLLLIETPCATYK